MFKDSNFKPNSVISLKTDDKKVESREKVREKKEKKNLDPFELKIKKIDDGIKTQVDNFMYQERLKKNEEDRKAFDIGFKRQKKQITLSNKFHTLNMKAKYRLHQIEKALEGKEKMAATQGFSDIFSIEESWTDRKLESMSRIIYESEKLRLPELSSNISRRII